MYAQTILYLTIISLAELRHQLLQLREVHGLVEMPDVQLHKEFADIARVARV